LAWVVAGPLSIEKPEKDKSICCPDDAGASCKILVASINPISREVSALIICNGDIDVKVLFLILEPVTTTSSTSSVDVVNGSDELATSSSATTSSATTSSLSSVSIILSEINKNGTAKNARFSGSLSGVQP